MTGLLVRWNPRLLSGSASKPGSTLCVRSGSALRQLLVYSGSILLSVRFGLVVTVLKDVQKIMLTNLFTLIAVVVNQNVSCVTCTHTRFTRTCELSSSALPIVETGIINGNISFKRRKTKCFNKTCSKCSIYENSITEKQCKYFKWTTYMKY